MSQVVYKYELKPSKTILSLPSNAEILAVGCQNDGLFIWAKVRPNNPQENRTFEVYGTGHEIPDVEGKLKFIGTALMLGGMFVWHVFERIA